MDKLLAGFILSIIFLSFPISIKADYVLPYPSYMPGHKLYKPSRMLDEFKKWWYFGTIAQFKYHLNLADKYLVEAKTLFEYKQYLLAVDALKRSNSQFQFVPSFIQKTISKGKDMPNLRFTEREAVKEHIKVLEKLRGELPKEFLWSPEREKPTKLELHIILDEAILIRKNLL